jgi:hypothetical protein
MKVQFTNPNKDNFRRNIMYASATYHNMTEKDRHKGCTAVIVGSGPSLNDPNVVKALNGYWNKRHTKSDKPGKVHDETTIFYGCKAAIGWLAKHHMPPMYGVSIDPGAHIACEEKIPRVAGVTHILASVTAPEVYEYLSGHKIEIFHSVCGVEEELELYKELTGTADFVQGGFNVINRALGVAQYHGCDKFVFAGVDSGWREGQPYYCDGTRDMMQKKLFMRDKGRVDGTMWESTPDMVASAAALARVAKEFDARGESEKFRFLGDVMPEVLRHKDEEFLTEVAS